MISMPNVSFAPENLSKFSVADSLPQNSSKKKIRRPDLSFPRSSPPFPTCDFPTMGGTSYRVIT